MLFLFQRNKEENKEQKINILELFFHTKVYIGTQVITDIVKNRSKKSYRYAVFIFHEIFTFNKRWVQRSLLFCK